MRRLPITLSVKMGFRKSPQTFLNPEIINNDSADDAQSEGRAHFKLFCVIPQCLLLLR